MEIDWKDSWTIDGPVPSFKVGDKVRLLRSIRIYTPLEDISWKTFWRFFREIKFAKKELSVGSTGEIVRDSGLFYGVRFEDNTLVSSITERLLEKV